MRALAARPPEGWGSRGAPAARRWRLGTGHPGPRAWQCRRRPEAFPRPPEQRHIRSQGGPGGKARAPRLRPSWSGTPSQALGVSLTLPPHRGDGSTYVALPRRGLQASSSRILAPLAQQLEGRQDRGAPEEREGAPGEWGGGGPWGKSAGRAGPGLEPPRPRGIRGAAAWLPECQTLSWVHNPFRELLCVAGSVQAGAAGCAAPRASSSTRMRRRRATSLRGTRTSRVAQAPKATGRATTSRRTAT